jgi:hypothetical protein
MALRMDQVEVVPEAQEMTHPTERPGLLLTVATGLS